MTNEPNPVQAIAAALGETERAPITKIARLITTIGAAAARALLAEALAIEANGGMRTTDGTRRRTPGGVFFRLARDRLPPEQRASVFPPRDWKQVKAHMKAQRARAPQPPAPPPAPPAPPAPAAPSISWADCGALIAEAKQAPGRIQTVKVTLIGRPGKVVEQTGFTLLLMKHAGPLPALPKGIPTPATVPETTYICYIGAKHWRGVAEAIKNPDDMLIVEGTQINDTDHTAIAVFATNVTTKLQQQAKRAVNG